MESIRNLFKKQDTAGNPAPQPSSATPVSDSAQTSPERKSGAGQVEISRHSHPKPKPSHPPQKHPQHSQRPQKTNHGTHKKGKLRAYIIGGLNEVGKNCLAIECNNDIVVVDVGMAFPDDEMLGVDFVIPDTTFLEQNKSKIRALIITHAHLDHIGALQHVLPKLGYPQMVMTKLTAGLVTKRLEEHGIMKHCKIHIVDPEKDTIKLGCFETEFFRVNHSIPDCMGVYAKTPAGSFVHTGDFKFDFTPVGCEAADLGRMAEIGKEGVDVIFCESTNAPKPGYCVSEKVIAENLHEVISQAKGRIILASFSSIISRIEQIVHFALKYNRKIFISGRSMQNTLEVAAKMGHFNVPKGALRKMSSAVDTLPANEVLMLTTGSQGEPRSALTRIGLGTHPQISIKKGDSVVFSSSPIPGNERGVFSTINNIIRLGGKVITNQTMDIHASGHGNAGDIQMMHALIQAKNIVPIHGEMFMRQAHKQIAIDLGYEALKIPLLDNGSIVEYENGHLRRSKSRIPAEMILIDGIGTGDVGTRVMEERKIMANGGAIVVLMKIMDKSHRLVGNPEVVSRGFIYMKESKAILKEASLQAKKSYDNCSKNNSEAKIKDYVQAVKRGVQTLIYKKTQREPMVIPLVISV